MYNALSEKKLVESNYPLTCNIKSEIAGVGFDEPIFNYTSKKSDYKYVVYIGRIDKGKGCVELMHYFLKFRETYHEDIKLIMIGNNYMKETVQSDFIIFTGFISEDEKISYLQDAEALIIPSPLESLSMVTLEAMIMGKPVLATRKSEVLKDHIESSKAGFSYIGQNEFNKELSAILNMTNEEKKEMADNGISYVKNNYNWDSILKKFDDAIDYMNA